MTAHGRAFRRGREDSDPALDPARRPALLLLLLWVVAGAARHVVFLFLVAALIAFLLNPIVRALTRVWIPGASASRSCT